MHLEQPHTVRERAESFGSVAEQYDRYRPGYPDVLIDRLAALHPARTLDVACGTGKLAVPLLGRGLDVLGVELDEQMAGIARGHGVVVEVGAFETWDDEGRRFDLITCGQGWHWIDPERGAHKAADLLTPGGTLALLWNYEQLTDELSADLAAAYRQHAPDLLPAGTAFRHTEEAHDEKLRASGRFVSVQADTVHWQTTLAGSLWVERLATYSDHITLAADRRAALLDAVRAVLADHGDTVELRGGTYTISARTPENS